MKKETKAERIFKATYYECLHLVEYGYEEAKGLSYLVVDEDDLLSTRTYNDIEKQIKSRIREIKMAYEYNVVGKEETKKRLRAIKMVMNTLQRTIEIDKEFANR